MMNRSLFDNISVLIDHSHGDGSGTCRIRLEKWYRGMEYTKCQRTQCSVHPNGDYIWKFEIDESSTFVSIKATFKKAGVVTGTACSMNHGHAYVHVNDSDTLLDVTAVIKGKAKHVRFAGICA